MENQTDPTALEARVRQAVAEGHNVQQAVHHLTLEALSAHNLNLDAIRGIMQAVVKGAREGIEPQWQKTTNTALAGQVRIKEAVTGLDAALAQFAEASHLALEEAAGRAQTFSAQDLARSRAELEALEAIFVETLKNAAAATRDFATETLRELGEHAQRTRTAVGEQVKTTLETFSRQMSSATRAQLASSVELARATADILRQTAAGLLGGLAERIQPGEKKSS